VELKVAEEGVRKEFLPVLTDLPTQEQWEGIYLFTFVEILNGEERREDVLPLRARLRRIARAENFSKEREIQLQEQARGLRNCI